MARKISKYQKRLNLELERKATELYKQGLSTRQVGFRVGRSHNWVWLKVKQQELS